MRVWLLAIVPSIFIAVSPSAAPPGDPPSLRYRIADVFPSEIEFPFPKDLIGGGCMTEYVRCVSRHGSLMLRGDPSWVNFEISWNNARRPVQLTTTGAELLLVDGREALRLQDGVLPMTWQPTPGVTRTPTGFVLQPSSRMIVRIDLSDIAATAPAGNYEMCFTPALAPRVPVRWAPESQGNGCHGFWLRDLTNIRLQLESLRRQSIELLAAGRCDEASRLADEMLALHPASAVAYRLRAIVAELQRRVSDAAVDLAHASDLLKSGADRFLILPHEPGRRRSAKDLRDWSEGLASWADPANGLIPSPDEGGPVCR
jgi:hypothetical protein